MAVKQRSILSGGIPFLLAISAGLASGSHGALVETGHVLPGKDILRHLE